jgi:putative effector of murein hydrolase LrgA (UPF0299 family)
VLSGLLWLLTCQLAGEVVVRLLGLDVPGPVVGIALLLLALRLRRVAPAEQRHPVVLTADLLLRHLQLLFVPAGVGVVAYAATLRDHALPLGLAVVGSWLLGLVVVGLLVETVVRRSARRATTGGSGPA